MEKCWCFLKDTYVLGSEMQDFKQFENYVKIHHCIVEWLKFSNGWSGVKAYRGKMLLISFMK